MPYLTRRRLTPERMDDPETSRDELAESFAFIRRVNARLGGASACVRCLKRWAAHWPAGGTIRLLDLGTGAADIPVAIARWAGRSGRRLDITGVDRHEETVRFAQDAARDHENVTIVQADALRLMDHFEPGSFDYAHAGMFLHHLPDVEVMTVLRLMDRLTTRGLIWNDLLRSRIGRIGARVLTFRAPPIVRHDAVVSVDAGFTRREALSLAQRVGLPQIQFRQHLFYRFTVTSTKPGG